MGFETTFDQVRERPRVLIAVIVWNMVVKYSARRSPGCFGMGAVAKATGLVGFDGEDEYGTSIMAM